MLDSFEKLEKKEHDLEMGDSQEGMRRFILPRENTTLYFAQLDDNNKPTSNIIPVKNVDTVLTYTYPYRDEAGISSFFNVNLLTDLQPANLPDYKNAFRINDNTLAKLTKLQDTNTDRVPVVIIDEIKFASLLRAYKKYPLLYGDAQYNSETNWTSSNQKEVSEEDSINLLFNKRVHYNYQNEFRLAIPYGLHNAIELKLGPTKDFATIINLDDLPHLVMSLNEEFKPR